MLCTRGRLCSGLCLEQLQLTDKGVWLAVPAVHLHNCALQTGDAFDLANLLCSLLLGADYNAMVVVGHAVQVRALPMLLQAV